MFISIRNLKVATIFVAMFLFGLGALPLHAQQTSPASTSALFNGYKEVNEAFYAHTYSRYVPQQRAVHPVVGTEKRCETTTYCDLNTPHGYMWTIYEVGDHLLFNERGEPIGDPRCGNAIRRFAYPIPPPHVVATQVVAQVTQGPRGEQGIQGIEGSPGRDGRDFTPPPPQKMSTMAKFGIGVAVGVGAALVTSLLQNKDKGKGDTIKGNGDTIPKMAPLGGVVAIQGHPFVRERYYYSLSVGLRFK
jgi:hypothetical protein